MRQHPGFRMRKLIRSLEDPKHFTNLRWFDSVDAYHTMTQHPDYQTQIARLSEYVDLAQYQGRPSREFMHIVLDD